MKDVHRSLANRVNFIPSREEPAPGPFLKWAGGKQRIAFSIAHQLGPLPDGATYFEPFLGGGAVFFFLAPRRAILSDLNPSLVQSFRVVKSAVEELIAQLNALSPPKSRAAYEYRRREFNKLRLNAPTAITAESIRLTALFIWLNHTCFNGLYRVDRRGRFNVPFGYHTRPFIFSADRLRASSLALRRARAKIRCIHFLQILDHVRAGDVVYLDPPYDPGLETPGFTGYTPGGFGWPEQVALATKVSELVHRGCKVLVSNSPTSRVRALYQGRTVRYVKVPRFISCKSDGRKPAGELLIQ